MLHAVFYGWAVAELIWKAEGGGLVLADIRPRDPQRFAFRSDGRLVLRTFARPEGEELPARKFWVLRSGGAHHEMLYGRGLAHSLYWPVWFKRHGARFWSVYLEKFGSPTALGRFDPATTSDEQVSPLLEALRAVQTDAGVALPKDMDVTLLEATRSGTATYAEFLGYWDRAIAKVILGQTMTTEDGSSRAQAQVHYEVRRDIVQADADLVCGAANRTWVRWLIDLVLPGAAYPQVWRDLDYPDDLDRRAERDQRLYAMGWALSADAVRRIYGEGYERRTGATPDARTAAAGPDSVQAAERAAESAGEDVTPVEPITEALMEQAVPALDALFAPLRAMVDAAASMEDLQRRIAAAYRDLPTEQLADLLAMAFATAEIVGRYDLIRESGDGGADGGA
ncbi:MAG: hypothetical protein KatS3mg119_1897 [Rhodothalassiaceae bacterium]|nr:MAG: hypothetical protein KatS3mg119_1897 [Rhodothalassiaceae bacterium]